MKSKFYLILFLFILSLLVPVSSQVDDNEIVILFDEAHNQFFDSELMQTALNSLEDALNVSVRIQMNYEAFNSSSLQGADLLIVTNPGLKSDGTPVTIGNSERSSIASFVDNGNSVLYMGNPYSHNTSITGHARPMNDLIIEDLEARMHYAGIDTDNVTIILDDFNNDGNNSHILIKPENIKGDVFTTELNDLTDAQFLLYSGFVITSNLNPEYYGDTSDTAYKVDQDYNIAVDTIVKDPRWMEAVDGKGRAMLIGSTIMFSDYAYDATSSWIDQQSNLELFQNLVAWLLEITPLEDPNLIDQDFSFFARYNLLIAIGIAGGVLLLWIGSLIYRKQMTRDKIFDVKIAKKADKKKLKEKTSSGTTSAVAKKKKQRRKRN